MVGQAQPYQGFRGTKIKTSLLKELTELKAVLLSRELIWKKMRDEENFLAHLLRHLLERAKKIR